MKQIEAKISRNETLSSGFYRMRVESPYLAKNSRPGQFVEVKCSGGMTPLLRRPFGVHRIAGNCIEILYEVVGKGTELLSLKKKGETVDIIGPLGNGFAIDTRAQEHKSTRAVIVAGGNGAAPLLFLAEELAKKKKYVYVLIGGRSKGHILCEKDFKAVGAKVVIATEDGSRGHKGLVTELLRAIVIASPANGGAKQSIIYACGPTGMLKAVSRIAKEHNVPCQVSLEEKMACGVGVCLGCPVKVRMSGEGRGTRDERRESAKRSGASPKGTRDAYKMVCKDGPVFDAEEVVW